MEVPRDYWRRGPNVITINTDGRGRVDLDRIQFLRKSN